MRTFTKDILDSMRSEMQVLSREEEKSTLGGKKGDYEDPYSEDEYYTMVDSGTWTEGGFVSGIGYSAAMLMITGSIGSGAEEDFDPEEDNSWARDFDNEKDLKKFLSEWNSDPDYVEAEVYSYKDGTYKVVRDNENTLLESKLDFTREKDEKGKWIYYHEGKQLEGMGHTHHNDSDPSYPKDTRFAEAHKDIKHYIYYNGEEHRYRIW